LHHRMSLHFSRSQHFVFCTLKGFGGGLYHAKKRGTVVIAA